MNDDRTPTGQRRQSSRLSRSYMNDPLQLTTPPGTITHPTLRTSFRDPAVEFDRERADSASSGYESSSTMLPWRQKYYGNTSFAVADGDTPSQYYNEEGLQMKREIETTWFREKLKIKSPGSKLKHKSAMSLKNGGALVRKMSTDILHRTRRGTMTSLADRATAFRRLSNLSILSRKTSMSGRGQTNIVDESGLYSSSSVSSLSSLNSFGEESETSSKQVDKPRPFWNKERLDKLVLTKTELKEASSGLELQVDAEPEGNVLQVSLEAEPEDPIPEVPSAPDLPNRKESALGRAYRLLSMQSARGSEAPEPPPFDFNLDLDLSAFFGESEASLLEA